MVRRQQRRERDLREVEMNTDSIAYTAHAQGLTSNWARGAGPGLSASRHGRVCEWRRWADDVESVCGRGRDCLIWRDGWYCESNRETERGRETERLVDIT